MDFASGRHAAISFDLFGTLVFFDPVKLYVDGAHTSAAMRTAHSLAPVLGRYFPGLGIEDFAASLETAWAQLDQEAGSELYEYSSQERFRRALLIAGVEPHSLGGEEVQALVSQHIHNLAAAVFMPRSYRQLLALLSERFRLALVSNFDHAPTARWILRREAIAGLFSTVVISQEVGRRKPHRLVFERALRGLALPAGEVMHVGDSPIEDVSGAQQVGITAVWVNKGGNAVSNTCADLVVPDLETLARLLA